MKEQDKITLKQKAQSMSEMVTLSKDPDEFGKAIFLGDVYELVDSIPVTDIEDKVEKLKEFIKKEMEEAENYEPEMQFDADLNDFYGSKLKKIQKKIIELGL